MAIEGAARYLDFAKGKLGRDDLAVVSYHMGVGNLQRALLAYGKGIVPYAQLYFDSSPLRHPAAWRAASLGDDSATYLWRVLAAREVMRPTAPTPGPAATRPCCNRTRPRPRRCFTRPRTRRPSATPSPSAGPRDGRAARSTTTPRAPRAQARPGHGRPGPAHRPVPAPVPRAAPTGPRRAAGHGRRVAGISRQRAADRDEHRARRALPARPGRETTRRRTRYSLHTTGFAFDIARDYRSRAQALAFQFLLDRLARGMIAWVREPQAIHVTVASR